LSTSRQLKIVPINRRTITKTCLIAASLEMDSLMKVLAAVNFAWAIVAAVNEDGAALGFDIALVFFYTLSLVFHIFSSTVTKGFLFKLRTAPFQNQAHAHAHSIDNRDE